MAKHTNQTTIGRVRDLLFSKRFFIIFTVLSYALFTFYYMSPILQNCSDTLSGFGDNTGGPIWRNSLEPEQPIAGGQESQTNYPYGEDLYSPVAYAAFGQGVYMKAASDIVGPVCAYNSFNVVGYLSTSLLMFAFVLYVTKGRWAAWVAGYAVAFTPYMQSKIGAHPSYGFTAILIAVVWLAIHAIHKRSMYAALGLGAVLAFCGYFDPYFVLLSATAVAGVVAYWLLSFMYAVYKKRRPSISDALKSAKALLISGAVALLLLAPLIYIRVSRASEINATTGAIRGNIQVAAQQCSNLPLDYLIPDPKNIALLGLFGENYTDENIAVRHWCSFAESRVSVSLVSAVVIIAGLALWMWRRNKGRREPSAFKLQYGIPVVIGTILSILLVALLLGLPPKLGPFSTLTAVIIRITEMWRIFAREYLLVNFAVIFLMAVSIRYIGLLLVRHSNLLRTLLVCVIVAGVAVEYQIYPVFDRFTFSYKRDVPTIYHTIAEDKDISAIAEYPLDRMGIESDVIVYYTTMQRVHKKPILNSAAIADSKEALHIAIKDLSDPQTIPVLRSLGINYITIHSVSTEDILATTDQLDIIAEEYPAVYNLTAIRPAVESNVVLARIKPGPQRDYAVTFVKEPVVNFDIMKSPVNMQYEALQGTILQVSPLRGSDANAAAGACFSVKMASGSDRDILAVSLDGKLVRTLKIDEQYSRIALRTDYGDRLTLTNSTGHNMRVDALGCSEAELAAL